VTYPAAETVFGLGACGTWGRGSGGGGVRGGVAVRLVAWGANWVARRGGGGGEVLLRGGDDGAGVLG